MQQKSLAIGAAVVATAFATSGAMPALADVDVQAIITKEKRVTVTEDININKDVDIDVFLLGPDGIIGSNPLFLDSVELDGVAEALAVTNQRNTDNTFGVVDERIEDLDELLDGQNNPVMLTNRKTRSGIFGSVSFNSGIVGVNQDSGSGNNQGNNVAMAFTDLGGFMIHAEAGGEQVNTGNYSASLERFPLDSGPYNDVLTNVVGPNNADGFVDPTFFSDAIWHAIAEMNNSINFNTGVIGVNQSAGDGNNQMNMVSASIGAAFEDGGDPIALSEGALGQENSGNTVVAANTWRKDELINSMSNNQGILGVNQTAGRFNNQANVSAIAATQSAASVISNN